MKNRLLLPRQYHTIGWLLLILFIPLGLLTMFQEFAFDFLDIAIRSGDEFLMPAQENFTNELAATGTLLGFLFISLARTKVEDEYIMSLRLHAWMLSMSLYSVVVFIQIWAFYGFGFVYALTFNMYLPFLFFYAWFRISLYRAKKMVSYDQ